MTTSTRIETALSAKAHGFSFVESSKVAVVSVICRRGDANVSLASMMRACVQRFQPLLLSWLSALPQHCVLLFAATPFWDQHNVISRRRGLWGTKDLSWLPAGAARSSAVEMRGADGLRFAGLAQISDAAFADAADFVRTHGASLLFVSPRIELDEDRVRTMFTHVFPRSGSAVDWAVVNQAEQCEDIVLRVSGGFDDPEISIDAFVSADVLSRAGGASR
jgi:hypothetical protein